MWCFTPLISAFQRQRQGDHKLKVIWSSIVKCTCLKNEKKEERKRWREEQRRKEEKEGKERRKEGKKMLKHHVDGVHNLVVFKARNNY